MTRARVHNENRKMDMRHVDGNWRVVRRGGALVGRGHSAGAVVVPVGRRGGRSARGKGRHQHRGGDTGRRGVLAFRREQNAGDVGRGEEEREAVEERRGEEDESGKQAEEPTGSREGTRDSTETRKRDEEAGREFASGEERRRGDRSDGKRGRKRTEPERNSRRHRESFV